MDTTRRGFFAGVGALVGSLALSRKGEARRDDKASLYDFEVGEAIGHDGFEGFFSNHVMLTGVIDNHPATKAFNRKDGSPSSRLFIALRIGTGAVLVAPNVVTYEVIPVIVWNNQVKYVQTNYVNRELGLGRYPGLHKGAQIRVGGELIPDGDTFTVTAELIEIVG